MELAREQMLYGCGACSIMKIEMEELFFLTGCATMEEGLRILQREFDNLRLILVTGGRKGSWAAYESKLIHQPTYLNVKTIDTTGAGDAFLGCCLDRILETGLENLTEGQLADMLLFANAAASIVTTRKGLPGMPSAMRGKKEHSSLLTPISVRPCGLIWNWPGNKCSTDAAHAAS